MAADGARERLARHPHDRRALVIMSVGHAIQHFYVAGLAVAYPFIVADLHVSYAVLGAMLTGTGILGGLLQGAAGLLRRMGTRAILGAQNAGLTLAALLAAVAPGFGLFAGARALGAAVSWPQHPVGSAYLSDRFPHRRATVLSWHVAGGSIGTVTVPLAMAAVIAGAGWRWALVALAGALGLGAVLVAVALPPEHRPVAAPQRAEPALPLRQLLRSREVRAVLVAATVAAGGRGLGTLSVYIPADLRSGLHLPAISVGAVFTAVMAASVAGPLVGGSLGDRFGRRQSLVVTYLAAAVALAVFGFLGRDLALLFPVGIAVGLLAYTESPLLQSVFSDLTEEGAGRGAFGVYFAVAYGVGSLWVALLGWIVDTFGFPTAFSIMAASFVVAGLVIAVWARPAGQAAGPVAPTSGT